MYLVEYMTNMNMIGQFDVSQTILMHVKKMIICKQMVFSYIPSFV